jgi:aminoglycoside phosphotransferase (APT) family kinase protein
MRGIVPVADVVEARPADNDAPAILVTRRIDGVPLDVVLREDLDGIDWEQLGLDVGAILARLSGVPFLQGGMFEDAALGLAPAPLPDDLTEWARHFRDDGRLAAWQQRDFDALLHLTDAAEDISAEAAEEDGGRVVLVHSDFNPKNILVDPDEGHVVGLVDWEFAYAGSPYADYGNLSRFEREDRLVGPAIEAFSDLAPRVRDIDGRARAADLWALIELAGGVPSNPVRELASELLLAQARTGNLHAWPWKTPRVDPNSAKPVP